MLPNSEQKLWNASSSSKPPVENNDTAFRIARDVKFGPGKGERELTLGADVF